MNRLARMAVAMRRPRECACRVSITDVADALKAARTWPSMRSPEKVTTLAADLGFELRPDWAGRRSLSPWEAEQVIAEAKAQRQREVAEAGKAVPPTRPMPRTDSFGTHWL